MIDAGWLRRLGAHSADTYAASLQAACTEYGIVSPQAVAAFVANVLHETQMFTCLVENMNYSVGGLLATFPSHFDGKDACRLGRTDAQPANQRGIAERVYGGRMGNNPEGSGDGWAFRAHGGLGLTGRTNFDHYATVFGKDLWTMPDWLITPEGACRSAARFFVDRGCIRLAEQGQYEAVRRQINGGTNGLDNVLRIIRAALAISPPAAAPPSESDILNDAELARIRTA